MIDKLKEELSTEFTITEMKTEMFERELITFSIKEFPHWNFFYDFDNDMFFAHLKEAMKTFNANFPVINDGWIKNTRDSKGKQVYNRLERFSLMVEDIKKDYYLCCYLCIKRSSYYSDVKDKEMFDLKLTKSETKKYLRKFKKENNKFIRRKYYARVLYRIYKLLHAFGDSREEYINGSYLYIFFDTPKSRWSVLLCGRFKKTLDKLGIRSRYVYEDEFSEMISTEFYK